MTTHAPAGWQRMLNPRVFFPSLLAIIALSVLLTPRSAATGSATILSTHVKTPGGASGLGETMHRLGWHVTERNVPFVDSMSAHAIYAVLVDNGALTREEMHVMLDRVRAGASLVLAGGGRVVRDSLHLTARASYGELIRARDDVNACETTPGRLRRLASPIPLVVSALTGSGPLRRDTVHIATARLIGSRDSTLQRAYPAIVGITLGRGRIALLSTPALLANDVIRACGNGAAVAAVRTMEWLSARDSSPALRALVFDEYHFGYGRHPSVMRATRTWLAQTPSGRTTLQLLIAALLLLAATAPRAIPPVPRTTIQRRSPLEHVGALADAYQQVRGTRKATRLLVQGVRRRVARLTATRRVSDEEFLAAAAARRPDIATDVGQVTAALTTPVDATELLSLASTIDRIERSIRA